MSGEWTIRPFDEARDGALRARAARRLNPGATVSPRDPEELNRYFEAYGRGERGTEGETFVAAGPDGEAAGLLSLFSEPDYFTGHARAYVTFLAVDEAVEGRGAGQALMAHAERWAREHGCKEVCLDVWGDNARAIGFMNGSDTGPTTSGWRKRWTIRGVPELVRKRTIVGNFGARQAGRSTGRQASR